MFVYLFLQKMVLIHLVYELFCYNLTSQKYPSHVINVRKQDIFRFKKLVFLHSASRINLNGSLVDLSKLEYLRK